MKVIPTSTQKPITIEFSKDEAEMLKVLIGSMHGTGKLRNFADELFSLLDEYENKQEHISAIKEPLKLNS